MQPEPNRSVYPTPPVGLDLKVREAYCDMCSDFDTCVMFTSNAAVQHLGEIEGLYTFCPECWFILNKLISQKFSELVPSWKRWNANA